MRIYFTLAEAAANRGNSIRTKDGKETPTCAGCRGDTNRFGCSTVYPRGARFSGVMAKPMCDKCMAELEYWRDRLCSVVPSSMWGQIEILPKRSDYLREILENDARDKRQAAEAQEMRENG